MTLGTLIESLLGSDLPVALRAYDGTVLGPPDSAATVVIRSPRALARMVQSPGELGLGSGLSSPVRSTSKGDIFAALALRDNLPDIHVGPREIAEATRVLGRQVLQPGSAAPRGGTPARSPPQPPAGPGGHLLPLRRLQRLLPPGPRPVDDLLLRGVE